METTADNRWFSRVQVGVVCHGQKRAAIKVNDCLGPDTLLLSHHIQLFRRRMESVDGGAEWLAYSLSVSSCSSLFVWVNSLSLSLSLSLSSIQTSRNEDYTDLSWSLTG